MFLGYRTIAVCLTLLATQPVQAETTLVAVAANFAGVAEAIAAAFTAETGHVAKLTTGSTGKLYAQITEGAPFEVLLSADAKVPKMLEADGSAVAQSRFTYAIGGLTLWSVDAGLVSDDPKVTLTADKVRFIAMANPDLAPYGVAAQEALTNLGLWDEVQPKIVLGQNIGQVFAMANAGAADTAFVARSALDAPGATAGGSRWDVPQDLFAPLLQDAVLLNAGKDNPAAIAFLDFLKGDTSAAIITSYGYVLNE